MDKPNISATIYMVAMLCLFFPAGSKAVSVIDLPGSSDTIALDFTTNAVSRDLIIRRGLTAKIFEIPGEEYMCLGRLLSNAKKFEDDLYWIRTNLGPKLEGATLLDYNTNRVIMRYTGQALSFSPRGEFVVWHTHGTPAVVVCNGAVAFYDRSELDSKDVKRPHPDDSDIYTMINKKADFTKCTFILKPFKWVSPSEFCFVFGETLGDASTDCYSADAETSYSVRIRISDAGEDELSFNASVNPGSADYESVPQNERASFRSGSDVTKDSVLSGTVTQRVKLLPMTSE